MLEDIPCKRIHRNTNCRRRPPGHKVFSTTAASWPWTLSTVPKLLRQEHGVGPEKAMTVVWRWQDRFRYEGAAGCCGT
jgi:hypothetical protein